MVCFATVAVLCSVFYIAELDKKSTVNSPSEEVLAGTLVLHCYVRAIG